MDRSADHVRRRLGCIILSVLLFFSAAELFGDVPECIHAFDDLFPAVPYNSDLDTIGTITAAGTLMYPSIILLNENTNTDMWKIGAAGAGVYTAAFLAKDFFKDVFRKPRPGVSTEEISYSDNPDAYHAFPSGHTSLAFSSAAFLHGLYMWDITESPNSTAVVAAGWSSALLTGLLRGASGAHHASDILAGSLLGSVVGFTGAYLLHLFDASL